MAIGLFPQQAYPALWLSPLLLMVSWQRLVQGRSLHAGRFQHNFNARRFCLGCVLNESLGVFTRVISAIPMDQVCEPYIRRRAVRHLEKGRVAIFAAGTGSPFFTTDTAAALRAIEIGADILLKATKVDGVYSADPLSNPDAIHYPSLSFDKVLTDKLGVMDATAIVMCRDNNVPLRVFNLNSPGALMRIVRGEEVGTLVGND